jgi:hypothetical protein
MLLLLLLLLLPELAPAASPRRRIDLVEHRP